MIIGVDFDDTIHDTSTVPGGRRLGRPSEGALDTIEGWLEDGHQVFILTARAGDGQNANQHIYDWLEYWKFPLLRVTNKKLPADLYVDDRNVRHINWANTKQEVKERAEIANVKRFAG